MRFWLLTSTVLFIFIFFSCSRERLFVEGAVDLRFSTDTLRFDTVFTAIGSATRILKIYNDADRWASIDRIALEGEFNEMFRMNVDGIPTREALDVEIPPNDSIYLFNEVTINPDQPLVASPYVIESRVVFETKDQFWEVILEAWGQNANYVPSRFSKEELNLFSCDGGEWVWDDDKPYVIYGGLFIDNCTLRIPAGAKVYVHGGLVQDEVNGIFNSGFLWLLQNGKINIEGTAENPVIIQGDRLEPAFEDTRGQWTGIRIGQGSRGNSIEHAIIKNSRFGIYADSASTLVMQNTQIFNTASSGVIGVHSDIQMDNCLVYNNGFNSIQLVFGGDYEMNYCTVASYGEDAVAMSLSNFICYVPEGLGCAFGAVYRLNAEFNNSVFFGSRRDELSFVDGSQEEIGQFNYQFNNCIVRVDELLDFYPNFYENCRDCPPDLTQFDALFENLNDDDYQLDSLSVAQNIGFPLNDISTDLLGNPRDAMMPDAGCFERED